MNFRQYIIENDKLLGLKTFIASSDLKKTFNPSEVNVAEQYHMLGTMETSPKEVYDKLGIPNNINETNYYDPTLNEAVLGTYIEWGLEFNDNLKLIINFVIKNKIYIPKKFLSNSNYIKDGDKMKTIVVNAIRNVERLEEFTVDTYQSDYAQALQEGEGRLLKLFPTAVINME